MSKLNTEMCIWCLEAMKKLNKIDVHRMSSTTEQVKYRNVHLLSGSHDQVTYKFVHLVCITPEQDK
jgi:hypothetical protein